jgi:hypothetical protein
MVELDANVGYLTHRLGFNHLSFPESLPPPICSHDYGFHSSHSMPGTVLDTDAPVESSPQLPEVAALPTFNRWQNLGSLRFGLQIPSQYLRCQGSPMCLPCEIGHMTSARVTG